MEKLTYLRDRPIRNYLVAFGLPKFLNIQLLMGGLSLTIPHYLNNISKKNRRVLKKRFYKNAK